MSQHRQLAAIMFTDIEGYTALMQRNEQEAFQARERHRNTFEITTEAFNGTIVQYFGDGTLSTFKSTVEAVNCAIELQRAFLSDPKIPVRIGIHVGDIIHSKDDIIGDAVNVASRIESCAIAGSILISDKVHDQIRSHPHIKSKFIDAYELKNVDGAMPIFAIANEGLIVPKREEVKGKLKSQRNISSKSISIKKAIVLSVITFAILLIGLWSFQFMSNKSSDITDLSIAVLPFKNLSTDNDAEIFRDGVTEDILTQLSKLKDLHVISRKSIMQFKNSEESVSQIAKKLSVSYVLQGSIRKNGDKLRVTSQLIIADTGEQIWAGQYDKTIIDIFAIQSEVSKQIVDALNINMSFEEEQSLDVISTQNIEAYRLVLKGRDDADKRTKESLASSILFFKEAIALDPNYAEAYAELANSIYLETYYSGRDPKEASILANEYLDKAELINNKLSRVYSVRGIINTIERKHNLAKYAFEKAIKLSPNDLTARHQFATFYYYSGQYEKQLEQAEIAYRLDPLSFATATSYFSALLGNKKYTQGKLLLDKIKTSMLDGNQHAINIYYFRLYMDQQQYKKVIEPLKEIIHGEKAFYRFLGYSYAKVGDTINAYRILDTIKEVARNRERSYQKAMVYAGLKVTDSVLFYLDTIRNKQTRTFKREQSYFEYLENNPKYKALLVSHGID